MKSFFITATGTGIGKTFVTTNFLRQLKERGESVCAIKPIISGYDAADMTNDNALILQSLALPITLENINKISPWRFVAPLSPDLASAKEGCEIQLNEVVEFCKESNKSANILLIEGIGGVMVPLNKTHTTRDWMAALSCHPEPKLQSNVGEGSCQNGAKKSQGFFSSLRCAQDDKVKIILVAGSYLGAVSHTLTAVEALSSRGLSPHALIINESENPAAPLAEIMQTMAKFLPKDLLIISIPRHNETNIVPDLTSICT